MPWDCVPGDMSRGGKGFVSDIVVVLGLWCPRVVGITVAWGLAGSVLARACPGMTVCLVGGGSTKSTRVIVPCGHAQQGRGRQCLEKQR